MKWPLFSRARMQNPRPSRLRFTRLLAERLEVRSLLALVGYQIHVVPPGGPVSGPELTTVSVGESYDLAVTVQDLRPAPTSGVFAGYLDIGYDSSKTRAQVAEIQRIRIGPFTAANPATSASGTFALTFNGQTTSPITFDSNPVALATAVQSALANLDGVGSGNVGVMVDVISGSTNLVLQVRFPGKFYDQNVSNMTVASLDLTGESNPSASISYEGDLQAGPSAFAFKEAFRSQTLPSSYPNGVSALDLPNLFDEVGAFSGLVPLPGTQPIELVRARLIATAAGVVTFTPDFANRNLPASDTLLYSGSTVNLADIDPGTSKTLAIVPPITIVAVADALALAEDVVATAIDVLSNDTTIPAGQAKAVIAVTQPAHGSVSFTADQVLYKPALNYVGSDTFTYTALNVSAGATSQSATATVSVQVTAVNDAPSFIKGLDQAVTDESGPQSVAGWATEFSAGPSDEAAQTLSFIVTTDNASLFVAQPAIDAGGKLTYAPAPNADGTAQITVVLRDNGGTDQSGVDASLPQSFALRVEKIHPLHNTANPLDAGGDGAVAASDVLDCINFINAFGAVKVADDWTPDDGFLDTNADGYISPHDPLLIINHINAGGEGESATDAIIATEYEPPVNTTTSATASVNYSNLIALLAVDTAKQSIRRRAAFHQS